MEKGLSLLPEHFDLAEPFARIRGAIEEAHIDKSCGPSREHRLLDRATLDETEMQYLYKDGDDYYFMDTTSYEQVHISSEALGDSVNYLKPEMTIKVEFYGTEPVGIELPQTVDLKVLETVPGIKTNCRGDAKM